MTTKFLFNYLKLILELLFKSFLLSNFLSVKVTNTEKKNVKSFLLKKRKLL